ncbi:uncharacterized protein LOC133777522 isoform X1 [Humulus lupulus]|uniref:uncharacterized protein LOC133777522 isoform X1 n=1 Tax=Humulus lupulus TaxID=3486 RepID=UPI002B408673|nr:uncharacterized protein LOC133777522 isoform X1 [Humulus lupulus]
MWLGSLSSRSFLQTYPSSTSPKVLNLHIVDFYSSKAPNKRKKNLKCFWKTISKVVSGIAPSTTLIAELSKYWSNNLTSKEDVAGAISDGFKTTALPAGMNVLFWILFSW